MPDRRGLWACLLAFALFSRNAAAHSPAAGAEGFYTGLQHPISTPSQLLALLALGQLLGRRWPDRFALPAAVYALALLGGLVAGQLQALRPGAELGLLLIASIAALLTAALPSDLAPIGVVLAAAGGLLMGVASVPDPGPWSATIVTMLGAFAGANLSLFYASAAVGWLRQRFAQPWIHVGLRIIAAWTVAISCLMLALAVARR